MEKKTLLIDTSHHSIRLVSISKKEETAEEGYQDWRYRFLKGIFDYIEQFKCNEVVLAIDSKNNWRKSIFPWYKSHRKVRRDADDRDDSWFNWQEYHEHYRKLLDDLKNYFPFKIIEVDGAEADDVVAILTTYIQNPQIVVTVDSDYVQLLQNPLVSIWSPMKKDFIVENEPKKKLIAKILTGDEGDYIPSVKDIHSYKPEFVQFCIEQLEVAQNETNLTIKLDNDEKLLFDCFSKFYEKYQIKPSKCRHFTEKMANGYINTNTLKELLTDPDIKRKFMRNNKLINLTEQPKDIKESVIEQDQYGHK